MKLIRRIFNKDELIGESILSKIDSSIVIENPVNGTHSQTQYLFEIDNFNMRIYQGHAFDMTSGHSWCVRSLYVDGIELKISNLILKKIFNKVDGIYNRDEYVKEEIKKEQNEMIYKDIKINFNNARK